ncbi:glycine betaine ABC transporter substrate-binding protein [Halanaerocella petrolearia]
MVSNHSEKIVVLISILVLALAVTGCTEEVNKNQQTSKKVKLGYVQWASAEASTHIIQELLKQLDYQVKTSILQPGAMYSGTAQGDIDALVCAWLPKTHKSYWDKYSDKLVDLGANFQKAKLGLVVPKYVNIDSITELKKNADKFNKKIIGIGPGAGIMQTTKNATIPKYRLKDWKLVKSSGPAMTTELKRAIQNKEPLVVTGWTPHWKWSAFDLKFLNDPKNSYGQAEMIKSIGRKGIKEDLPTVTKILKNFDITTQQLGKVMNMIEKGKSPEKAATTFINNNPKLVNQWLPKGKKLE